MKHHALLAIVGATLSIASVTTSADESYVCQFGNNERTIRIEYSDPNSKVPCDVVYEKETGSQILWNAQNEPGYCESQAEAFVEKQRGWGWECTKTATATEDTSTIEPMEEPAPVTTTEPVAEPTNEPEPVLKDILKTGTTN